MAEFKMRSSNIKMYKIVDIKWLISDYVKEDQKELIFFWGHQSQQHSTTDRCRFIGWFNEGFFLDSGFYRTSFMYTKDHIPILFDDIETVSINEWYANRNEIVLRDFIDEFKDIDTMAKYDLNTCENLFVRSNPQHAIWGIGIRQNRSHLSPDKWSGFDLKGFALLEL